MGDPEKKSGLDGKVRQESGGDRESAASRRRFVRESLEGDAKKGHPKPKLSFETVKAQFGSTLTDQTLYTDAQALQKEDYPIFARKKHFEYDPDSLRTVNRRALENEREKRSIARTATRLVMPQEEEWKLFAELPGELRLKLEEYWKKAHRLLILDAGSTTEEIARHIARVSTPDSTRKLSHLRVLTNGDVVHSQLNKRSCTHGLIFLGGAERFDTGAIAGTLAERCLDAWGLQADMAIIGTTNLNKAEKWCCDHEDEGYMKSRLLDSARIRCIAADSWKLVKPGAGSSFPFADFTRFMGDIVITDPRIHEKHDGEEERRRISFLKRAKDQGIVVATEPKQEFDRHQTADDPEPTR